MILLPVLNEAEGLRAVLKTIPHASLAEEGWQSDVVIVDGKSTDSSQQVGAEGGCVVLVQPSKGKEKRCDWDSPMRFNITTMLSSCLMQTKPTIQWIC